MNKILFAFLLFHAPGWAATPAAHHSTVAQYTPDDEMSIEDEIDQEEDDHSAEPPAESELSPPEPAAELTPAEPQVPEGSRPIVQEEYKPSSSSGEKIFDWSKYPGDVKEVPHPFYEKGLIRITRDKTYIYKVDESEQKRAADLKVGMFNPTNLVNPDSDPTVTFEDNYDQTNAPAFLIDYEWQLWRSPIGKWGLRAGTGFYVAQGHGHFNSANGTNADKTPLETFTFLLMPFNVGAVYRMQVWHKQLLIPYGEGGGTLFGFTELRDDNKPPKFGGSLGAYFAGGVAFNLTYFDALSRIALDREYGINSVYLTVEYRAMISIMKRYDFTSDFVNAGLLMEY